MTLPFISRSAPVLALVFLVATLYGAVGGTTAEEFNTVEQDWCILRSPKSARIGETVRIEVSIKPDVVQASGKLCIDMHGSIGKERKSGLGHAAPVDYAAGAALQHVVHFTIPDREGLTAAVFPVWINPTGTWDKSNICVTSIECAVTREASAEAPAPAAVAELTRPTALRGPGNRLFILSGQSNMVGFNPNDTFVPALQQAFPAETIVVVKDAENGQPIKRWYCRKTGDLYARLYTQISTAIQDKTFTSVTFVWMQGESDGSWAKDSGRYEANLTGLMTQLRSDLAWDDMTVVIGRISDHQNGQEHWDSVRAVQEAVATADPLAAWIDTDDLNEEHNDLHYRTKEGRAELGRRFAAQAISLISKGDPPAK